MSHLKTGVGVLDDRLGGGFAQPSTILFFSDHPSEKRLFAEHFIITGLREGERCLYVDFFRAPQLARRDLRRFGPFPEDRLAFVDATSAQLLVPPASPYAVRMPDDLDHIMDTIEAAIRDGKPSRVVIDSMEYLADRFPKEDVFRRWVQLLEVGRTEGAIVSYLFLNWTYDEADVQRIRGISDYVVEFRTKMRTGLLEHFMQIRENRPEGVTTNWIPFTFSDLTGLTVYFPRILVTGPYHAGKSTVVRSLCGNAVNVERMGTTVAFDYGNVQMSGLEAEIFGTPGQERFEFIFGIFAREVSGVLFVVDSTKPEDFARARQMLSLLSPDVPLVVLANKSDLANVLPAEEIRKGLELRPGVPIVYTVADKGAGVREALLRLAEGILGVR